MADRDVYRHCNNSMQYVLNVGFYEVLNTDDVFTLDMNYFLQRRTFDSEEHCDNLSINVKLLFEKCSMTLLWASESHLSAK